MNDPLLEALKNRCEQIGKLYEAERQIASLIAEVERLRAENARLRSEVAQLKLNLAWYQENYPDEVPFGEEGSDDDEQS